MSSHREAPEISKDPVADSTDLYAFVTPGKSDTVTLIANYLPMQLPSGGPNFYEFGDDVQYDINVDNNGDGRPEVTFRFRFRTEIRNDKTFLYNTGPIESLDSENWNRRQFYSVSLVDGHGREKKLADNVPCPPVNIGPASTPNYADLAKQAVRKLGDSSLVFAGQRADPFFVDLGSIFDLGILRPFQNAHLVGAKLFKQAGDGVNSLSGFNVLTIALQVPVSALRAQNRAYRSDEAGATIGVWTAASRRQVRILGEAGGKDADAGPFVQVSRLGNPLFNEVVVPMAQKDLWNTLPPSEDKRFVGFVETPELAGLLPVLYPGVFPKLDAANKKKTKRADLVAILLTGIPAGIIDGFQNNTGATQADMLRLNTAIPPAEKPNALGVVAGDLAGFPNGRRPEDDVVTVEIRAIAGLTLPLVDKTFTPDAAASAVTDGLTAADVKAGFLKSFPFLGTPLDGFNNPKE
ncbi:hypothetical protein Val02_11110 [Virgisporangium aliadipatigenens]|uniref:DUF4331 domain-containing protein n=1 Tax=Virgisporangium aliadipatigenens TaxID=741659 RepID=A0A8J3YHR6_9ACTN|nr:DUF4331 domain-containing protein [Virgisporangium aliadipatigenens]GIJ44225.1 hypothetical protein Val02_11110 [Virgisporangium aliadipatigenens]